MMTNLSVTHEAGTLDAEMIGEISCRSDLPGWARDVEGYAASVAAIEEWDTESNQFVFLVVREENKAARVDLDHAGWTALRDLCNFLLAGQLGD